MVVLEGDRATVVDPVVGFHHEAPGTPEEVDGSAGVMSEGQRWRLIPLRDSQPEVDGTETWTGPSIGRRSFQRTAAEV